MKKAFALVMVLVLITLPLLSCKRNDEETASKKGRVIKADDPWYEVEQIDFDKEYFDRIGYGDQDYTYVQSDIIGQVGENWLIHLTLSPADNSEAIDLLELYSSDGSLIRTLDCGELHVQNLAGMTDMGWYPQTILITDESITYQFNDGIVLEISPDLTYMIDCRQPSEYQSDFLEYMGEVSFDNMSISKYWASGSSNSTVLKIVNDDGETVTADLREDFPYDVIEPYEVMPYHAGEMTYILLASSNGFYKIDPYSGKASYMDASSFSWLDGYDTSDLVYIEGEGCFLMDTSGIYRVDVDQASVSEYFLFDECNINRYLLETLEPYYVSDTTIILKTPADWFYSDQISSVVTLTKCETNPNAGKTVITIGGYLSGDIYEAIRLFNESDSGCFIVPDDRYYYTDYLDIPEDVDAFDSGIYYTQAESKMSDRLAVDLISGEGPDLFYGASSYPQLMNSDLFIDLNGKVETDDLWTNIVAAYESDDGCLYSIPLSFDLNVILTSAEGYGNELYGMSLDDYSRFTDEVMNGKNILTYNRLNFIKIILPSVIDYCISSDGKVDFNNDAFRTLCEYTNENIHDTSWSDQSGNSQAEYVYITALGAYLDYASYNMMDPMTATLLATPSYDASGIRISPSGDSISVSAVNSDVDGAVRFVEFLLSYDLQMIHASRSVVGDDRGRNLINISAFEDSAKMAIDSYNSECDYYLEMMGDDAIYNGVPSVKVDETALTRYEDIIRTITDNSSVDPAIDVIVYEELQAYFEGQKTLDEVISIINNRAQLVMDER